MKKRTHIILFILLMLCTLFASCSNYKNDTIPETFTSIYEVVPELENAELLSFRNGDSRSLTSSLRPKDQAIPSLSDDEHSMLLTKGVYVSTNSDLTEQIKETLAKIDFSGFSAAGIKDDGGTKAPAVCFENDDMGCEIKLANNPKNGKSSISFHFTDNTKYVFVGDMELPIDEISSLAAKAYQLEALGSQLFVPVDTSSPSVLLQINEAHALDILESHIEAGIIADNSVPEYTSKLVIGEDTYMIDMNNLLFRKNNGEIHKILEEWTNDLAIQAGITK